MSGKKRKTTTTVEEIVPTDGVLEEDTPSEVNFNLEDVREAEQLEEIASQFPNAGITLKLYDENGAYCVTIPDPKSIDEELIRKRCGAGNFRLRIYINGKYRHYIPLPIREIQPDSSVTTPNSARNGDSSNSHSDFFRASELQAQRNHELLLAAIGASRSTGPSITDLTTALANIDSLRGKQESGVDLIMKGIDLAQRFSGDTDWKSDLIRMGKDVLPKIADGVTAVMGHRNGNSQQIQPVSTNENQQKTQEFPSTEAIRAGINYLKRKCLNGVEPDLIIDWVAQNADEYQGLIRVILNKDFSEFAQYDIEIGSEPFLGWFKQLFDGLRSAFSPTDSMDDTSGGLVGDTDHIRDNGDSGKGRKPKPEGPKASA